MLVPRSFRYASSSERLKETFDEKGSWRSDRGNVRTPTMSTKSKSPARPMSEPPKTTDTTMPPPTKPVAVPTPQMERRQPAQPSTFTTQSHTAGRRRKMPAAHDPQSLPPSVAALLAVTQIPRPKSHQVRRRKSNQPHMSIDELVQEWKNDMSLSPSYGSSPAMSMLLQESDESDLQSRSLPEGQARDYWQNSRSTSAESVPLLENDDQSILSLPSPPTPEFSLRKRRSISSFKKEKVRSLPATEDCGLDHPLEPSLSNEEPDDSFIISSSETPRVAAKSKGRFTSNLTLSLQALKNAAMTKISALSLSNASAPSQRTPSSPLSDDVLWSHPFLFPRFSPEVRPPTSKGTPSKAERRYLNPLPLTFEEQEAPFQQALHAPYLAEEIGEAPTIQMQTYHRGRRKANANSKKQASGGAVDPNSEAGRALAGADGVKMREPRENGDFLRVVVLEMNMRRVGKLENGRAKMWLPPRQVTAVEQRSERVPVRWRGVSAY